VTLPAFNAFRSPSGLLATSLGAGVHRALEAGVLTKEQLLHWQQGLHRELTGAGRAFRPIADWIDTFTAEADDGFRYVRVGAMTYQRAADVERELEALGRSKKKRPPWALIALVVIGAYALTSNRR
jgi:hypothetical protein